MENPKHVHSALVGFVIFGSVGFAGLSLYLWHIWPIAAWVLVLLGSAMLFGVITLIFAVTVWPILLLIGRILDRPSKTASAAVNSTEPPAPADRGPHPPGRGPTGSAGCGS
jgi:hypothetical protein